MHRSRKSSQVTVAKFWNVLIYVAADTTIERQVLVAILPRFPIAATCVTCGFQLRRIPLLGGQAIVNFHVVTHRSHRFVLSPHVNVMLGADRMIQIY
jgi:hypothetical protein